MPTKAITNRTEAEDLIRGLTFMGTGGGGRPDAGRELLNMHLDRGDTLGWTDLSELPDDAWACCAFTMGSTAPRPADFKEGKTWPEYGTRKPGSALPLAVRELEEYTGKKMSVVFALELGASNTPGPMHAAVELGLKLADGEGCGRAVPEASQILPALAGVPMWPASICDEWGNVLILKSASSLDVAEALGKGISMVTKVPDAHVFCGMACYAVPVREMKKIILPGTITRAFELGKAIREAREAGKDPVEVAANLAGGWVLFRGVVSGREWENTKGYQIGTTEITGTGEYSGHSMRIWFKNEHHISWLDGNPFVTSPDLLAVVHSSSGEPITNTYLAKGDAVAVVGMKAAAAYRSAQGVAVLGPRHFGFDLAYRPIEDLVTGA
jgi:uncharacterized protein